MWSLVFIAFLFVGGSCHSSIDVCNGFCLNGGICFQISRRPTSMILCSCTPCYTGDRCEKRQFCPSDTWLPHQTFKSAADYRLVSPITEFVLFVSTAGLFLLLFFIQLVRKSYPWGRWFSICNRDICYCEEPEDRTEKQRKAEIEKLTQAYNKSYNEDKVKGYPISCKAPTVVPYDQPRPIINENRRPRTIA